MPRNFHLLLMKEVTSFRWRNWATTWLRTHAKPVSYERTKMQFTDSHPEGFSCTNEWNQHVCRGASFSHANSLSLMLLASFCQWGNWGLEQWDNSPEVPCSLRCRENFKPMNDCPECPVSPPVYLAGSYISGTLSAWGRFFVKPLLPSIKDSAVCSLEHFKLSIIHTGMPWQLLNLLASKVIDFQENVYILFILVSED